MVCGPLAGKIEGDGRSAHRAEVCAPGARPGSTSRGPAPRARPPGAPASRPGPGDSSAGSAAAETHLPDTHPLPGCPPSRWPSRWCRGRSGARRAAGRRGARRGPAWRARRGAAGPGRRRGPRRCSCAARGWRPPRARARRRGPRPGSARPAAPTTRSQAPGSRSCAEARAGGGRPTVVGVGAQSPREGGIGGKPGSGFGAGGIQVQRGSQKGGEWIRFPGGWLTGGRRTDGIQGRMLGGVVGRACRRRLPPWEPG